ncbi:MAG: DUF2339 domain-containing protein, partial [Planctomycetota bacterium]
RPVAPKHDSPFIERPGVPSTGRPKPPPVSSPSTEVFAAIVVEEEASAQNAPVASLREGETANDSSVAAALRRFWNWIVVGEEYVPKNVSYEYAVVTTWLIRLGVLILLFGIGFFLKYSIDRGWITPMHRALMAASAGVAFILTGGLIHRKQYRMLAQGLMAAGVATLHATIFASLHFYHLIELDLAFTLLVGVTVLGGVLALVYDAGFIATLAAAGGYLSPVLAGSEGSPAFLYIYLAALTLGVLLLAFRARWTPLAIVSFVGVYGWLIVAAPRTIADMPLAVLFWSVFFVLFSGATIVRSLTAGRKANVFGTIYSWLIAGVTFGFFAVYVGRFYGAHNIAWPALGMALFYGVPAFLLSGYGKEHAILVAGVRALAVLFAVVGTALIVRPEWIGLAWAGEVVVLGWLTVKNRSSILAASTAAVGAAVLVRTLGFEWVHAFRPYLDGAMTGAEFLSLFHERFGSLLLPAIGTSLATGVAAGRFGTFGRDHDGPSLLDRLIDGGLKSVCAGGVLAAVAYAVFEAHLDLGILAPAAQWSATTAVLFVVAGGLLLKGTASRNETGAALFGCLMLIGACKFFIVDTVVVYAMGDPPPTRNAALLEACWHSIGMLAGVLVAAKAWMELRRHGSSRAVIAGTARGCLALVPALPTVFLMLEAYRYCGAFEPGAAAGAVSSVLALGALAAIALGIALRERFMRWGGVTLIGVVIVKIFLVDLAELDSLYRIIAFLTIGVLLLAAAILYLRFRSVFMPEEEEDACPVPPLPTGDDDDTASSV